MKKYLRKLAEFQYLVQDQSCKMFLEKKIEVKKTLIDLQYHDPNIVEIAEKFRETFPYLMEIKIQPEDLVKIEKFDIFIKNNYYPIKNMKKNVKAKIKKLKADS